MSLKCHLNDPILFCTTVVDSNVSLNKRFQHQPCDLSPVSADGYSAHAQIHHMRYGHGCVKLP